MWFYVFPFNYEWVGVGDFSKVVTTFNHVGVSFNLFMAATGDGWTIPSSRIWGYVLHVEHVPCVTTNKVSESSLPLSLNSPLGVAGGKYHKKITLPNLFFKILLFQAAFRLFFSIVIFLLTFFWLVWYCGVGLYFSQATWTKWTLMSAVPKMPLIPHSLYFVSCLWPVYCVLSMWGKIIIPMHTSWLHGLYGLHGPRCPLY